MLLSSNSCEKVREFNANEKYQSSLILQFNCAGIMKKRFEWIKCIIIILCIMISSKFLYAEEPILVIRENGVLFEDVVNGMVDELDEEFKVYELIINKKTTAEFITQKIEEFAPKCVVLMDNKAIGLFMQYQQNIKNTDYLIPSVSVMGVLVDKLIKPLKNAACIYYEIPIVTSIINLRSSLNIPIKKVGVIHRKVMNDFVQKNKKYCKSEKVKIISRMLPNKGVNYKYKIKEELKRLLRKDKVDALWIPNDNVLLRPEILGDVWLPLVQKYKKPLVVGTESLVNPKINFGTYAVLPDHISLGIQTAELIYEVMNNGWEFCEQIVEPPVSVYKIINLKQVKENLNITKINLENVDKILQ